MNERLGTRDAAQYCGLTAEFLRYQIYQGRGPAYIKPSPKRMYFTRQDLDAWMDTWKRAAAGAAKAA